MFTKTNISSNYLAQQQKLHGHKQWNWDAIRAIVYGALKSGSIGETICNSLNLWSGCVRVWAPKGDVRLASGGHGSFSEYNALILSHGLTHLDWFEDTPMGKAKDLIDVNLYGTALMIRKFVRETIDNQERKRIIVIGSMAHRKVLNGSAIYCATKAGVAMLCRCLAWELAPKGFDVFCIHPSNVYGTPMTEDTIRGLMRYRGMNRGEAEDYWGGDTAIRERILEPHDIARLVLYLLGDRSEYLAGGDIELGGGQR